MQTWVGQHERIISSFSGKPKATALYTICQNENSDAFGLPLSDQVLKAPAEFG
jgi:hypothetical protein